jgi:hypothetical protein
LSLRRDARSFGQGRDGPRVLLEGVDRGVSCQRHCEGAKPREEIGDTLGTVHTLAHQLNQCMLGLA